MKAEFIYLATSAKCAGPINRPTAVKGLKKTELNVQIVNHILFYIKFLHKIKLKHLIKSYNFNNYEYNFNNYECLKHAANSDRLCWSRCVLMPIISTRHVDSVLFRNHPTLQFHFIVLPFCQFAVGTSDKI